MRSKVHFLVGPQEPLLATVKRWKLAYIGRVTRRDSLPKIILQDTGGRRRGRQRKCWMDNIKDWTSLPMPELQQGPPTKTKTKRLEEDLC